MVLDRCLVPMVKADLSFTLTDFGNSDEGYLIDFKQPHNALIKGYGKWTFSVMQNAILRGEKGFVVFSKCEEDCPDDSFNLPATGSVIARTDTELLAKRKAVLNTINTWNHWKSDRGPGVHIPYSAFSSRPFGERVTVSVTINAPRPIEQCTNIDAEMAGAEFAKMCFRSIDSAEDLATVQFRGRNFSVYPSVLREHSAVLSDLLDIHIDNEEPLMIDLREFSSDVGRMFLEILFSGVVKATINENRAQHISNLMKLYELGPKYLMDKIMLGAIDGFKNLQPKATGSEAYDFIDLLTSMKSQVGDDFKDYFLEVRIKPEHDEPREEPIQEPEPQSR